MLARGTTLAGYRLDAVLGKGGMGVVYEATQLSLNRTVALKVLAPHLSDDAAFRERFRREGQIQAAIDHPNIVTVYEAGETEHGLFIAMRLVRGSTLKDMILAGELDPARTFKILRPVADALDTAHEAGLIHRDVKPQNVLVAGRDHTYLADFGLTKSIGESGLTQTGQFVGTVDYIAPEQIRGEAATGQCDVYALAAVLFECLTGAVPYARDSDVAVLYAHISDPATQRPAYSSRDPRMASANARVAWTFAIAISASECAAGLSSAGGMPLRARRRLLSARSACDFDLLPVASSPLWLSASGVWASSSPTVFRPPVRCSRGRI